MAAETCHNPPCSGKGHIFLCLYPCSNCTVAGSHQGDMLTSQYSLAASTYGQQKDAIGFSVCLRLVGVDVAMSFSTAAILFAP